ncbi:MAG TPA: type II toxin-antitoxin system VapC family toxin [Vineibacter sp.]|nr:type II toxin-antitoxin system VapC family toxin [Vineibacter sp.]
MFIDASAIIAVLADEREADGIATKIETAKSALSVSPVVILEAVANLARIKGIGVEEAHKHLEAFLGDLGVDTVAITPEIGNAAVAAFAAYGKGRGHKAQLNLGDCFAYACAKSLRVPLLFVGDDFTHTDIKRA